MQSVRMLHLQALYAKERFKCSLPTTQKSAKISQVALLPPDSVSNCRQLSRSNSRTGAAHHNNTQRIWSQVTFDSLCPTICWDLDIYKRTFKLKSATYIVLLLSFPSQKELPIILNQFTRLLDKKSKHSSWSLYFQCLGPVLASCLPSSIMLRDE